MFMIIYVNIITSLFLFFFKSVTLVLTNNIFQQIVFLIQALVEEEDIYVRYQGSAIKSLTPCTKARVMCQTQEVLLRFRR